MNQQTQHPAILIKDESGKSTHALIQDTDTGEKMGKSPNYQKSNFNYKFMKGKYEKDPFGLSIENDKRTKFFNERLSKYGDNIMESLILETMDNVHEASGELVGTSDMTQEKPDEHLNDARMIILRMIKNWIARDMKECFCCETKRETGEGECYGYTENVNQALENLTNRIPEVAEKIMMFILEEIKNFDFYNGQFNRDYLKKELIERLTQKR
jgi:hypothetical protein